MKKMELILILGINSLLLFLCRGGGEEIDICNSKKKNFNKISHVKKYLIR